MVAMAVVAGWSGHIAPVMQRHPVHAAQVLLHYIT